MKRKIIKFLLIIVAILIVLASLKYIFLVALFTIRIILFVLAAAIIGYLIGHYTKTN